jgi:hypothetical protein
VLLCTLRITLSDRLSLMLIIPSSAQNQTKSPLLRVPGDIRNMIMEYALSETDGLRYRFPEEGSHRFYPRPICTPVMSPASPRNHRSVHQTQRSHLHAYQGRPPAPGWPSPGILLSSQRAQPAVSTCHQHQHLPNV